MCFAEGALDRRLTIIRTPAKRPPKHGLGAHERAVLTFLKRLRRTTKASPSKRRRRPAPSPGDAGQPRHAA